MDSATLFTKRPHKTLQAKENQSYKDRKNRNKIERLTLGYEVNVDVECYF